MSFLAPLFLVGLLGLAVPVLVHLTRHERGKPLRFPSLMFLERIPFRETSRRRIRHWLLLAVRLAVLALVAFAFARPFVRTGRLASVGGLGPEEVVILIDQSYSMGLRDHWQQAVSQVNATVGALGPLDRVSLIAFDESPRLLHRSITDHRRVPATLDTMATGSLATRIAPALKLAATTLASSNLSRQRVVLVSDFQRTGWRPDRDAALPEGVMMEPIVVGEGDVGNLALADLELNRESTGGRDRVAVRARLVNTAETDVSTDATLMIDETEVQALSVSVPAGGAVPVAFDAFTLTDPFTRGEVKVTDAALQDDNVLSFVASPGGDVSVLIVDPQGPGESNLYLRRALGIAQGAGFASQVVRGSPGAGQLDGTDVVVLNDAPMPGGDAGARLREFVTLGGGLIIVAGERSRIPADQVDGLPATLGSIVDASGEQRRLGFLDYDHAVFEAFRGARSGDFSRAGFYRTRALTLADGQVLARFDDGAVALVEGRLGKGRVLIWASGLDRFWNDLPLQPIYLPFIHQLVRHLAGDSEAPAWHEAGTTVNLAQIAEAAGSLDIPEGAVAMEPGGGSIRFDPETPLLRLHTRGVWEIRPPGQREDHPLALAVNVDLTESDLGRVDMQEFLASVGGGGAYEGEVGEGNVLEARAEDFEKRQGFWRYLLVAAFLLMASETVLANWLSRHAIKPEAAVQ